MDFQTISGLGCPALPGVTRPLAAAQPRHARPTQQPSEAPAEERVPKPNSASGGREKAPSRGRLARSQGCRGRLARSPGCGRIPGKGGVSIISRGMLLPGIALSCPLLWVPFVNVWKPFFPEMGHHHPGPPRFFLHPFILAQR